MFIVKRNRDQPFANFQTEVFARHNEQRVRSGHRSQNGRALRSSHACNVCVPKRCDHNAKEVHERCRKSHWLTERYRNTPPEKLSQAPHLSDYRPHENFEGHHCGDRISREPDPRNSVHRAKGQRRSGTHSDFPEINRSTQATDRIAHVVVIAD
jgi:hypothetical protein